MKRTLAATLAVGTMLLLCACGSGEASKAGGDAKPVTLRIGTDDEPGRPAGDAVEEFARQVTVLSGGQIRIEPLWTAAGPAQTDADQQVAQMVIDRKLDMGMVPARVWDTLGVNTLRALQAPYLITSNDLMSAVVTTDVAGEMLAGLDKDGVVGLALVPESLREVFSFAEPLLAPEQFNGMRVRVPMSNTSDALFESMGATGVTDVGESFSMGVQAGTIGAAESGYVGVATLPSNASVVGNLVLFAKVQSLVVNERVFADLTEEQQGILRTAAANTRAVTIGTLTDSADAAAQYCTIGGTVVLATQEQLSAFERAAEPVYRMLESDAATKSAIDTIRNLKAATPDPANSIAACAPAPPTGASASSVVPADAPTTFPDGIYRTELHRDNMLAAGVEAADASGLDGISTLTFRDGHWTHSVNGDIAGVCGGRYSVESGRVVLVMTPACGGDIDGAVLFSAAWTLDGAALTFHDFDTRTGSLAFNEGVWGGTVWEKIG